MKFVDWLREYIVKFASRSETNHKTLLIKEDSKQTSYVFEQDTYIIFLLNYRLAAFFPPRSNTILLSLAITHRIHNATLQHAINGVFQLVIIGDHFRASNKVILTSRTFHTEPRMLYDFVIELLVASRIVF